MDDRTTYLCGPPPVSSVQLIIDLACPVAIGVVSLRRENEVIGKFWVAKE